MVKMPRLVVLVQLLQAIQNLLKNAEMAVAIAVVAAPQPTNWFRTLLLRRTVVNQTVRAAQKIRSWVCRRPLWPKEANQNSVNR